MAASNVDPTYYADFNGLKSLKREVKGGNDDQAIRKVAQQFESLFTNMMLQSMREAKIGDGLGDSQATDTYTEMYDQQLSLQMSQGKGLGLADMLVAQLTRNKASKSGTAVSGSTSVSGSGTSAASSATTVGGASKAVTTGATTSTSGKVATQAERASFVSAITPYAQKAASALGVSCDAVIAQAALETGWGTHVPTDSNGNSSCNLFGIKSTGGWSGSSTNALTTEYVNGSAQTVSQGFRSYGSVDQSMQDYVSLLSGNSRYAAALGTGDNSAAFARALQQGGYATDPTYAQKLEAATSAVKVLRGAAQNQELKLSTVLPTTVDGKIS